MVAPFAVKLREDPATWQIYVTRPRHGFSALTQCRSRLELAADRTWRLVTLIGVGYMGHHKRGYSLSGQYSRGHSQLDRICLLQDNTMSTVNEPWSSKHIVECVTRPLLAEAVAC